MLSRVSLAAVLAGMSSGLIGLAPAGADDRWEQAGSATLHTIADGDDERNREMAAYFLIYRGIKGCQSLGSVFSEADVALAEGYIQARFAGSSLADRQKAWAYAETHAGDSINKLYFMPEAKRDAECQEVADVAGQFGVDLPSQR
ncbi:hypothetical protein [Amorphus sp. MBR-141]